MRNQEKPKNNVSSKQYFEAGAGGGGGAWLGVVRGMREKSQWVGKDGKGNDLESNFLTLRY